MIGPRWDRLGRKQSGLESSLFTVTVRIALKLVWRDQGQYHKSCRFSQSCSASSGLAPATAVLVFTYNVEHL